MGTRNEHFKKAVMWLIDNGKAKDQKELAAMMGLTETSLSRIMNGQVKQPKDVTIRQLNETFPNTFNMDYFRAESDIMLKEDVNTSAHQPTGDATDMSSVVNAIIAANADTIASLKREIVTIEESARKQLETKDELVESLRQQISDLQQMVALLRRQLEKSGMETYTFPHGAADTPQRTREK